MIYRKSEILGLHLCQVVKVKAMRIRVCQGQSQRECRKFNINFEIASFSLLKCLIARAFNIESEFSIFYRSPKFNSMPMESDEDLETAIAESWSSYLQLEIQPLPYDKALEEWDVITPADIPPTELKADRRSPDPFTAAGSFLTEVGKKMQRAFSFESSLENSDLEGTPLTLAQFEKYLDNVGRMVRLREFHMSVYQGGVEPSLRPLVWKHLLNVFPDGLSIEERKRYLVRKSREYYKLKQNWKFLIQKEGDVPEVLKNVTTMVRKDVRRTDRTQKFFAGSDENENVQSLFNILTTYGVNHQRVSYCQGMSDILSPILFVMKNEAHAYISFCGLMKRLEKNFCTTGRSMKLKFRHLRKMLHFYDQKLFIHLKENDALDLLYCYRWLILELKREFKYNDALHVLEVLWGSLPPKPPREELNLFEIQFPPVLENDCMPLSLGELSWSENHFGKPTNDTSSVISPRRPSQSCSIVKWVARARRQSLAQNSVSPESSTEEETKELQKCSWKNLSILENLNVQTSRSFPFRKTDYLQDHSNLQDAEKECINTGYSWTFGESFEGPVTSFIPKLLLTDETGSEQWCYSNTMKELILSNALHDNETAHEGNPNAKLSDTNLRHRHGSSDSSYSTNSEEFSEDESQSKDSRSRCTLSTRGSKSEGYISDAESSFKGTADFYVDDDDSDGDVFDLRFLDSMVGNQYEEALAYFGRKKQMLPPPHVLGDGNPFLLFLCVAMILQQRDVILKRKLDFNELGMFFDKLVRKHKVAGVLSKARCLFGEYLNMGWNDDPSDSEDDLES